eukprot:8022815-Pyramimonas_sp.AAC.1
MYPSALANHLSIHPVSTGFWGSGSGLTVLLSYTPRRKPQAFVTPRASAGIPSLRLPCAGCPSSP